MHRKELTKKEWTVFWCFMLVLAVVAVCVFPLPISNQLTFCGAKVTADGIVLEECEFTVEYTKLNYLFREDGYSEFALDVGGMHFDTTSYYYDLKPYTLTDTKYEWITLTCYNAKANAIGDDATICYGADWEWCFVKTQILYEDEAHYFVGYLKENPDYQTILEKCDRFLD